MFFDNYLDSKTNEITRGIFKGWSMLRKDNKVIDNVPYMVFSVVPPLSQIYDVERTSISSANLKTKKDAPRAFTFEVLFDQNDLKDCEKMENFAEFCLWAAALNECVDNAIHLVSAATSDMTWDIHQREIEATNWEIDNNMPLGKRTELAQSVMSTAPIHKKDCFFFYNAPLELWRSDGFAINFADRFYGSLEGLRQKCATVEELIALNACGTEVGNQFDSFLDNQVFPSAEEGAHLSPEQEKLQTRNRNQKNEAHDMLYNFHRTLDKDRETCKSSNSTNSTLIGKGK